MPSWESRIVIVDPGCAYRGPVFIRGGLGPMMHLGCIIFLCRAVPLDLPMWWGRVPFFVRPGDVVRVQHLLL
jgi:hypothetical protein